MDLLFALLLLQSTLSNDRQTNKEFVEIESEEFLYFPELNRTIIFSLYFLRMSKEIDYFLRKLLRTEKVKFPGSISMHLLSFIGMMLGEYQQVLSFLDLLLPFDRAAKIFTFSCGVCSSSRSSGISVSLLSKLITNFFHP